MRLWSGRSFILGLGAVRLVFGRDLDTICGVRWARDTTNHVLFLSCCLSCACVYFQC
jgi:hypothetical protein